MKHLLVFACLFAVAHAAIAQTPGPTEKLIARLKSKKAEKRIEALVALAELGPKAEAAIPALAKLLPGIDDEERILATMALAKIGKASLPTVERLLTHEDETTRYYAVWTLGLIGKDAKAYAPRLLAMFDKDDDEEVRVKAVFALARVAPESKEVVRMFANWAVRRDAPFAERLAIIEELRHCGPDALEPLVKVMDDVAASTKARESLAHLLTENKNAAFAKLVLPHLPGMLAQGDTFSDLTTGDGLSYFLAKHGDELFPVLEKKLHDKNAETRLDAIKALGTFAANLIAHVEHPELVKKINALLLPKFKVADTRTRLAIAATAPHTEETAAAFEELLIDDDLSVRMSVIGRIQMAGIDPVMRLRERMQKAKDADKTRMACALHTMARDPQLGDLLWARLNDKDEAVRYRVACALISLEPVPAEADKMKKQVVPVLIASLKSDNVIVRERSAFLLTQSTGLVADHVPALLDRLDDPALDVRVQLLMILQTLAHADAKASLRKLVPLLKDDDETIRQNAVLALSSLGKASVPHLAPLAHQDKSQLVQEAVCIRLGMMKAHALAAIPDLLLAAQASEMQGTALHAILAIAPEKNFSAVWEVIVKNDARLKNISYPKSSYATCDLLRDTLLSDWRKADAGRRRELDHALDTLLPFMPMNKQVETMTMLTPLIAQKVKIIEKGAKANEAKVRLEAIAAVGPVKSLHATLVNVLRSPEAVKLGEKKVQKLHEAYQQENEKIDQMIRAARIDTDLQVRRAARKIDTTNVPANFLFMPGQFLGAGPFGGPFNPFGPGIRPGTFRPFVSPPVP